jgi:hypothetical protein
MYKQSEQIKLIKRLETAYVNYKTRITMHFVPLYTKT